MRISGINKFTMVNYPGKLSCVLFTKGCPLHCKYCYNKTLLTEPDIPWQEIQDFLEDRKKFLDGVVFSGGEPMSQYQELLDKVKYVKSLGLLVGLHLTGLNSDKPEFEEIINLADWIGLDYKAPENKYKDICGLSYKYFYNAFNLILNKNIQLEIRTTLDNNLTKEDLLSMEDFLIKNGIKKWYLQRVMLNEGTFEVPDYRLDDFTIETVIR